MYFVEGVAVKCRKKNIIIGMRLLQQSNQRIAKIKPHQSVNKKQETRISANVIVVHPIMLFQVPIDVGQSFSNDVADCP